MNIITREVSLTTVDKCGYRIPTPHGDVYVVAREDSDMANRIIRFCADGSLQEFVAAYQGEAESRLVSDLGNCHRLAFEFVYAFIATSRAAGIYRSNVPFYGWSWSVAHAANIVSEHSWIEWHDESMNVMQTDAFAPSGTRRAVVVVQPRRALWRQYQVSDVELRPFSDVACWLEAPRQMPLFRRHPQISAALSDLKYRIRAKACR